ncbi:MAG: NUDIX domain-containing protein [Lachnospiraceae bacterium]|nr:NUDIX domain-containing protein [Lachnospiraceae bacterium]
MEEVFDIIDENGIPTGKTISRNEAHGSGVLHRTAHIWVVRKTADGYQVLLQKRNAEKDSYPSMYDTSSAGHILSGDEPLESAQRELFEELGINAGEGDLSYAGKFHNQYEEEFNGKIFRDNEISFVYVYEKPVNIENLKLQKEEVDEVRWFDLNEAYEGCKYRTDAFCAPIEGLDLVKAYLRKEKLK